MNNKGQTLIEYILLIVVVAVVSAVIGPKIIVAVRHKLGYLTVDECVTATVENDFNALRITLRH